MFWIELIVVLGMLLLGVRYGGIFLGMSSGIAIAILVFVFHCTPGVPPIDVMMIIMTVVVIASVLQASGGMEYLIQVAIKLLRKNPKQISFFAPLISYVFTFMCGTGNIVFSILPVIAEVSREAGVRPERPISISVIASQQAITACPISAATVALLGFLAPFDISLIDILIICIPSTLIGVLGGAFYASYVGKDLAQDDAYLARVAAGAAAPVNEQTEFTEKLYGKKEKMAVGLYILATVIVVIFGLFPSLRPVFEVAGNSSPISMTMTIEIVMMVMAGVIIMVTKTEAKAVIEQSVFKQGLMGVYAIFGLAWAGDTLVKNNIDFLKGGAQDLVVTYPWVFAFVLFFISALILSQAATVGALMPLGIALGIPAPSLIGMFPAVNGYFFIPSYATLLAGIAFDRTGTTKIGKFVFNHSYMMPGLITSILSVGIGLTLASVIL
jgi:anaerobic C4-dicarboxylate transporter DcuA